MPRSRGMTGSKWFQCARSGWWFPVRERAYDNGIEVARRFLDRPGGQAGSAGTHGTGIANDPRVRSVHPNREVTTHGSG